MKRLALVLIALAGLPACQGSGSSPRKLNPESPKRLAELPESYATLWKAWLLKDPRYPMLREQVDSDARMAHFLVENLIAVVLGELTAGRVDSGTKSEPSTLQRARMELVALGPLSANALSEVLVLGAGLGPVAVEELLIQIGGPAVEPLLIQLARDDTPTARRRASRTLGEIAFQRIPAGMTTEAVRAALSERLQNDKDWIVRSQCALALASWGRSTPQDMSSSAGQLVRGLVDPDDQVRRDVIQALGRLGDPRTLPALINHLERSINAGELGEIVTTQKALGVLSGEAKKRTPEQWRAWWRDHRPRILERIQAEAQN